MHYILIWRRLIVYFWNGQGISFSDLMYVTKRNMASAVTNLTKHLEGVSEALAVSVCSSG